MSSAADRSTQVKRKRVLFAHLCVAPWRRAALCAAALALGLAAAPAQGAAPEPDFVFVPQPQQGTPGQPPPPPVPPPTGKFNGPCGLGVDSSGRFYISDYYHDAVDVYTPPPGPYPTATPPFYVSQLTPVDPLDGPCALALDASKNLYVNVYHRRVAKFGPSPGFAPGPVFSGDPLDDAQPTGVAVDAGAARVYVDNRDYIAVFDLAGNPILDGPDPLRIGTGSLADGYGVAVSGFAGDVEFPAGTDGYLYAADASDDTVKVYDPALDKANPVATIDGSTTPEGRFVSLRDSAVAVDDASGAVYVVDNLQPEFTEEPQGIVYVFDSAGVYQGHLRFNVVHGEPSGLAVDNSGGGEQGRVYVTSGNTDQAGLYAYPSGSAVRNVPLPPSIPLSLSLGGGGEGSIAADLGGVECDDDCETEIRSGATVSLTATPAEGSGFAGWSGGGCEGTGECAVRMSEARSVDAAFEPLSGPPAPTAGAGSPAPAGASAAAVPPATPSAISQKGNLRVKVSGKLRPRRLPRVGTAPIAVSVGGRITTTDQTLPPQLKTLRIELNRHGRLDYQGLPTCKFSRIQPGSSSRALSQCRSSLVGKGSFTANITLAGQEPYPTRGRLLVFNSKRGRKPVLFGHIYSPKPFATSFVIVFKIQRLRRGTYGIALNAPLPKAMDAWGRLTGLTMNLSRRYFAGGRRHSFLSSGCPAPKGFPGVSFDLARTSFAFDGGPKLTSTLTSTCKARG